MAKAVTQPKHNGVECLVTITRAALQYRSAEKPNLAVIGRLVGRAVNLLGIKDLDERLEISNKAAFQVAREMNLMKD